MSTFKDNMGRWFTKGLFWETCSPENKDWASYTLKDAEHKGLPSLKQLYLACEDPTEYEFATQYLGGWAHWKALKQSKWFAPQYEEWVEELEVRLRSDAIRKIAEHSRGEKGYQAAKYLADKGWDLRKAGAPSKAEKQREMKVQSRMHDEIDEDMARILN